MMKIQLIRYLMYHFGRNCKLNIESFPESVPNDMQKVQNTQDNGKRWDRAEDLDMPEPSINVWD